MKLRAASAGPPWSYRDSIILEEPRDPRSFSELISRVAKFSTNGLLDMGSRILWYTWQSGQPEMWSDPAHAITRAFAAPVVSLGMMFGGDADCPQATELEFRLLCWELHNQPYVARPGTVEYARDLSEIAAKQAGLPGGSLLRRVPSSEASAVRALWTVGRIHEWQSHAFAFHPSELVRPLLLYEVFRDLLGGPLNDTLLKHERTFFGTGHGTFARAQLALLALGNLDPFDPAATPGRIDIDVSGVESERIGTNDSIHDLAIAARNLATPVSKYRSWAERIVARSERPLGALPEIWSLRDKPGLILKASDGKLEISIPSPWYMRAALSRFPICDFVDFLAGELGEHVYSLRGEAFHRYLRDGLAPVKGILCLDDGTSVRGKRPDFEWRGETYGILVEAKARLTPNSDPQQESIRSVMEAWSRAAEAIEQASEYLKGTAGSGGPERWVLAIVVLEHRAAEATSFRYAAKRWGLLEGTALCALALLSPAALENGAAASSADVLGRRLERAWLESDLEALDQPPEEPQFSEGAVLPHIRAGWARLFPTMPAPWNESDE